MTIYTKLANIVIRKATDEETAIEALRRLQRGRVLEILLTLPPNLIADVFLLLMNQIIELNKEVHHSPYEA